MAAQEQESAQRTETAQDQKVPRPARVKLSAEETLKRMEAFQAEREEEMIAAVRKGKN